MISTRGSEAHAGWQGAILEALAMDGGIWTASLDRLGERFGLSTDDLRTCLHVLDRAGWIVVHSGPTDQVTVRLE